MNEATTTHDVYALVTNRIIEQLEKGTVPWRKPWIGGGLPQNMITGVPYRGINVWMLAALDYEQNFFLTWNQVKEIGASVKKGEKGHLIVFWKRKVEEEKEADPKPSAILRYYWVFNISQCENVQRERIPEIVFLNNPIERCEEIVDSMPMKPPIQFKESRAYYSAEHDLINMPKLKKFKNSESYYNTLFHELVHSTGHSSRLNRKELSEMAEFGSEPYSMEELIAEIGATYLSSHAGIHIDFDNNVAYINGWLQKLKSDKRFVLFASSQAQKAIDFILTNSFAPTTK